MGLAILVAIVAEITSVVLAAEWLGGLFTLALLALGAGLGMAVLAGRGVLTLTNAGQAMQRGEAVGRVVADGALLALAGLFFILPGFVSDVAALLLLLPFVRALAVGWVVGRVKAAVVPVVPVDPDIIDTTATERKASPPELP